MALLKLFARAKKDPENQLKEILDGYELPTFPAIYLEALKRVRDEDSSSAQLADVLSSDPGLTVKLLRSVNSAAFGARNRIQSVHHAVSILGRGHIESMLISLASSSALPSDPHDGFEPKRFWRAAARRAATARTIAGRTDPGASSECFTAALLQDMAIPVLCARKGQPYARLLERWHDGDGELQAMEREEFGWDHAYVAALMANEWGFPASIAEAIASHHGSGDPTLRELVPVSLTALIREVDDEANVEELIEQAHAKTGLDRDRLRELVENSFRDAAQIAEQFT